MVYFYAISYFLGVPLGEGVIFQAFLDEMAPRGQGQFSGEEGSCELLAVNTQSSCRWVYWPGKEGQGKAPTASTIHGFSY